MGYSPAPMHADERPHARCLAFQFLHDQTIFHSCHAGGSHNLLRLAPKKPRSAMGPDQFAGSGHHDCLLDDGHQVVSIKRRAYRGQALVVRSAAESSSNEVPPLKFKDGPYFPLPFGYSIFHQPGVRFFSSLTRLSSI